MADAPRDADTIRDDLLDAVQTEFRAIDVRVVTTPRTPWYAFAYAVGVETEGAEASAAAAMLEPFPLTCSDAGVARHAEWSGLPRLGASHTTLRLRVQGTTSSVLTIPAGAYLTSPAGLIFDATAGEVTTDVSGYAHIAVSARDAGAAANLTAATVLTWQPAPDGFAATAIVHADTGDPSPILVVGADEETLDAWRLRLHVWRRDKAQGGNRADWSANVEAVEGVGGGCVYGRAYYGLGAWHYGYAGTLIVVPVAAAPPADSYVQNADGSLGQGLDPAVSRVPSSTLITRVGDYLEGASDAAGRVVPAGLQVQRRPCGFSPGSYAIRTPGADPVDVQVLLRLDPAIAPWPWLPATDRVVVASTTSTVTLNSAAGISRGERIAIEVAGNVIRGERWCAIVSGVAGSVVTFTPPMPIAASTGALVSPDPGPWALVRAAVLRLFDGLGPRDVLDADPTDPNAPPNDTAAIASARFPRPADRLPHSLLANDVVSAVRAIRGVVDASCAFTFTTAPFDSSLGSMTPRRVGAILTPGAISVTPWG